jgi:hypothetical protein
MNNTTSSADNFKQKKSLLGRQQATDGIKLLLFSNSARMNYTTLYCCLFVASTQEEQ